MSDEEKEKGMAVLKAFELEKLWESLWGQRRAAPRAEELEDLLAYHLEVGMAMELALSLATTKGVE